MSSKRKVNLKSQAKNEGPKMHTCEKCGGSFRKPAYLKQHMQSQSLERSNLNQHGKAFHLTLKPFACSISGCGMRFSYKNVRDNHVR